MSEQLLEKIRATLMSNMLEGDKLERKNYCGEDSAQDSFERGEKSGAHDLATKVLAMLNKLTQF